MSLFNQATIKSLSEKLDPQSVKKRSQAGRELSYIEGWHAIAEANRIFGFDGWYRETIQLRQLGEPYEVGGKVRVNYSARVRVTVGDIVREGCGFGQGIDKDVGQAHEGALKEAETDAMKRALMTFGNPFGLALYDKTQANVGPSDDTQHEPQKVDPELISRFKSRVDALAIEGPGAIKAFIDAKQTQSFISKWPAADQADANAYAQEAINLLLGKAKEAAE